MVADHGMTLVFLKLAVLNVSKKLFYPKFIMMAYFNCHGLASNFYNP